MDIGVQRNAYGRQVDSFEDEVDVEGIDHAVRGVFIRAPQIADVGRGRRVLAEHEGDPVVLEQGNIVVASFHPELVGETGLHRYVLEEGVGDACRATPSGRRSSGRRKRPTRSASNMYAKLLRAVEVAAREGGGNVEGNMTLARAVEKAKSFSVPNDNIERAIKRGTGELGDGARYEELLYEGYAAGGVALLIEALTDNRNRTGQEVRHAFTRNNGNMGEQGSTGWMFTRKGVIVVEKAVAPDEERLLELALESGAEDLSRLRELLGHRHRTRRVQGGAAGAGGGGRAGRSRRRSR